VSALWMGCHILRETGRRQADYREDPRMVAEGNCPRLSPSPRGILPSVTSPAAKPFPSLKCHERERNLPTGGTRLLAEVGWILCIVGQNCRFAAV